MHEIKALHIKSLSLPMPAGSGEPSPKPASVHRYSFIYLWQKYYVYNLEGRAMQEHEIISVRG